MHRDIKPENILLTRAARWWPTSASRGRSSAAGATGSRQTGLIVGTPAYMSPEQAVGEGGSMDAAIVRLGCVVYEMLAGEPPFAGETPQAMIARASPTRPQPSRRIAPEVPAALDAALRRRSPRPADRFASAAACWRRLSAVAARRGRVPPVAAAAESRRVDRGAARSPI